MAFLPDGIEYRFPTLHSTSSALRARSSRPLRRLVAARIAVARHRVRHGLKNPWRCRRPCVTNRGGGKIKCYSRRSTSNDFSPQSYNLCDERFIPGLGIAEARHVSALTSVAQHVPSQGGIRDRAARSPQRVETESPLAEMVRVSPCGGFNLSPLRCN